MWKYKISSKELNVYARYQVCGVNQDYLINLLYRKGISLYNVKKISSKKMLFSIRLNEVENFFAITDNLCYNIKRTNLHGKGLALHLALRNFGAVLGSVVLAIFCFFMSDFLFEIEYTGNGKILEREISNVLQENGVEKYSRFSKIDLTSLQDEILASSENLTFASCTKHGNKMIIELVLTENGEKSSLGEHDEIISEVNGVIEDIKVYRGTSTKSVGDVVEVGDVIVEGKAVVKEEEILVKPIAYVSIIVTEESEFFSTEENLEEFFSRLAEGENSQKDIVSIKVTKQKTEDGYLYLTTLSYRYIIQR